MARRPLHSVVAADVTHPLKLLINGTGIIADSGKALPEIVSYWLTLLHFWTIGAAWLLLAQVLFHLYSHPGFGFKHS